MLVLYRKIGERILVPNYDLTVTVTAVKGKKVWLGFSAPTELEVYREEAWQKFSPQSLSPPRKE